MPPKLDLTGNRFGKLTALKLSHKRKNSLMWLCLCDCGNTITVSAGGLRSGNTRSCDCLRKSERTGVEKLCKKRLSSYKGNAKSRGLEFSIDEDTFVGFLILPCSYCGDPNAFGVDRVDNTRGYISGNCVSCCAICNHMKSDRSVEEFCVWLSLLHSNLQKRGLL